MGETLLITFRETLEASLVIGLILAVLKKAGKRELRSSVWAGLLAGVVASLGVAMVFIKALGEFGGRQEQLFEGTVMAAGAILLATLILWTGSHGIGTSLGESVEKARAGGWLGIAALVFVSVLREGVETVIYLGAGLKDTGVPFFIAGFFGMALAAVVGFLVFSSGKRLGSKGLFAVTTSLLLLFGAGLFGRAAGEFVEAGILPPLVESLWSIAPAVQGQALPLLNDHGTIGSFLSGLFGYVSRPSLTQVLAYLAFAFVILAILAIRARKNQKVPS